MKISAERDPIELRRNAYKERDPEALHALWDAIERLSQQGIDIGDDARAELERRRQIRGKFSKR